MRLTTMSLRKKTKQTRPIQLHGYGLDLCPPRFRSRSCFHLPDLCSSLPPPSGSWLHTCNLLGGQGKRESLKSEN